jgi:uracil-DNA glycosylase
MLDPNARFALRDISEQERRKGLLRLPHMQPLVKYLRRIQERAGSGRSMPDFDPCDGGIFAKFLFLLEAPGPRAVGSSFISRNNPDQTAKNMNLLLQAAKLPRASTLLWNIVPWYIGEGKKIRGARKIDVAEALPYLSELIGLLPELKATILVGKPAGSAAESIQAITKTPLFFAPHPSPKVFNIYPHKRQEAQQIFNSLRKYLK